MLSHKGDLLSRNQCQHGQKREQSWKMSEVPSWRMLNISCSSSALLLYIDKSLTLGRGYVRYHLRSISTLILAMTPCNLIFSALLKCFFIPSLTFPVIFQLLLPWLFLFLSLPSPTISNTFLGYGLLHSLYFPLFQDLNYTYILLLIISCWVIEGWLLRAIDASCYLWCFLTNIEDRFLQSVRRRHLI